METRKGPKTMRRKACNSFAPFFWTSLGRVEWKAVQAPLGLRGILSSCSSSSIVQGTLMIRRPVAENLERAERPDKRRLVSRCAKNNSALCQLHWWWCSANQIPTIMLRGLVLAIYYVLNQDPRSYTDLLSYCNVGLFTSTYDISLRQ